MSPQFRVALARSVYGGLLTGAYVFLGTYATVSDYRKAGLLAAGALVLYLIQRGGAEGWVDTNAARQAGGPK